MRCGHGSACKCFSLLFPFHSKTPASIARGSLSCNLTRTSSIPWSNLSWNLAGSVLSTFKGNPYHKTFLFKVLYDALPNDHTKHKYSSSSHTQDFQSQDQLDLPPCPLCKTTFDSLTHLFTQCTHESVLPLRNNLLSKLSSHSQSIPHMHPLSFPTKQLTTLILTNLTSTISDHRSLLGLFPTHHLNTAQLDFPTARKIVKQLSQLTIPYLNTVWSVYCSYTHPPKPHNFTSTLLPLQNLPRPPRLTIISGNNATITLTTIDDHAPSSYRSRSIRIRKPAKLPSSNQAPHRPQSTIPHFFSITKGRSTPTASQSAPTPHLTPPSPYTKFQHPSTTPSNIPSPEPTLFHSPKHPLKTHLFSPNQKDNHPPSQAHNTFSLLPVSEPDIDSLSLVFPSPYQRIYRLSPIAGRTQSSVLSFLNLIAHDVPPNGDCFYLAIQLYLSKVHPQPNHLATTQTHQALYQFLTTTKVGQRILRDHNHTNSTIALNLLPGLKASLFPNRDIYASDCAISAMATLLNSTITIISLPPNDHPLKYQFLPYPHSEFPLHTNLTDMDITLWSANSHFQLLLPSQLPLPTQPQLPRPMSLPHNVNSKGLPIHIPTPPTFPLISKCFSSTRHHTAVTTFCTTTCHQHCTNHYLSFQNKSIRCLSHSPYAPSDQSQLITLEVIPPDTPIIEISATIFSQSHSSTTPMTSSHHSDAPSSHPLIRLTHSSLPPNCTLRPLSIPEPTPHLKLFLCSTELIPPYDSLRIRPPPEPPPSIRQRHQRQPPRPGPFRITSYFSRILPPPPSPPP